MTVQGAVSQAGAQIEKRDAEVLLAHVLQQTRAWMLAHPEALLTPTQITDFFGSVSRRACHWPLQYLTGRQEFFGFDLQLSPDVLIPRPETELLVEAVLDWTKTSSPEPAPTQPRIVDVGTGSGAIALALAHHLPRATLFATDISPHVRPIVELNANRLGLQDRIRFVHSDLLSAFEEDLGGGVRFDAIVSNPPYVPLADAPTMQPEVRDFEPHLALFAGEDGLSVYRRLIPQAWEALRPGGLLALEFGFGQKDALAFLLKNWDGVRFLHDYAGIPRIALATRAECKA